MRIEIANITVRYTTCELPEACPGCSACLSTGTSLREVNYTESAFRGCAVDNGDGVHRFDIDGKASMGELELPWHPVRYECASCGLVLVDGAELADKPRAVPRSAPALARPCGRAS